MSSLKSFFSSASRFAVVVPDNSIHGPRVGVSGGWRIMVKPQMRRGTIGIRATTRVPLVTSKDCQAPLATASSHHGS
jgi:hypothetical protein